MAIDGRTADDIEAILAVTHIPGGELTWLDLVRTVARVEGVDPRAVYSPVRLASVVRARHRVWQILRLAGYSYPEIAAPWGADHTTVISAIQKLARLQQEAA